MGRPKPQTLKSVLIMIRDVFADSLRGAAVHGMRLSTVGALHFAMLGSEDRGLRAVEVWASELGV